MKLNEITETGFYTGKLDNKRETIYEVINNTDEEWLKETPEQKLLIDEWTYEYTDEDNRKHYEIYSGNLVSVVNAEPIDVIKITDTKYTMDVSDPTIASKCNGTAMMEDKPTRLEIAEQQLNQLKAENILFRESNINLAKENANLQQQLKTKDQECLELKERLSCNCFDPKSNNNRCVSYNRIAEDYERDSKRLDTLEACIIKIISMCEKASTKSTFCNGVENKDMQKLAIRILKVLNDNKV